MKTITIQVDGKNISSIVVDSTLPDDALLDLVKKDARTSAAISGRSISRVVRVPYLVNLITDGAA